MHLNTALNPQYEKYRSASVITGHVMHYRSSVSIRARTFLRNIPSRPALMPALKPSLWEWSDWSVLLSASCSECNTLPGHCVEGTCCWAREGDACSVTNRYFYFIAVGNNITGLWELLELQVVTSARTSTSQLINRYFYFRAVGNNITGLWELPALQMVTSARTSNS